MARGDFPRRHCKIIFQSIVAPKLVVPRSTRGHDGRSKRQAGRYAKQQRHRNRHAMDTLTLRPGGPCRGSGGFAARRRSWCFTSHRDLSDFVADPEDLTSRAPQSVSQCDRSAARRSRGRNLAEEQCAACRSLDWDSRIIVADLRPGIFHVEQ
jgi:hypothetical protein